MIGIFRKKEEKDRQKDIEIALINAESKKDTEGHSLNLEKMVRDFEIKQRELELKERELEARMRTDNNTHEMAR